MDETTPEVRERAVKRLRDKRDLATHAVVYVMVNSFIVVIWYVTSSNHFFWPIFPIAGWGIGLAMNAWTVWRGEDFTEEQVEREVARLERREHHESGDR